MTLLLALPFAAAALSLFLAAASVLRKVPSRASWCFCAGMAAFGLSSLCVGLSLVTPDWLNVTRWLTAASIAESFAPAAWLCFSLSYSRGNARSGLARWRVPLVVSAVAPVALALGFAGQLVELQPAGSDDLVLIHAGPVSKALNAILLVAFALALMNLEATFRSAVGTTRWRIKYVVLGLATLFGAQLYARSQLILFSVYHAGLITVESAGLLTGGLLLVLAYARTGLAEADIYPSRAVLRSSITVLIVGGYLFTVGVLAQVVRSLGGAASFQFQALVILMGLSGLAVVLLSDRLRQRVQAFVGRHFRKAQHDSVRVWTEVSSRLADVRDVPGLCTSSARLVAETFEALSVTVWLDDASRGAFIASACTAEREGNGERAQAPAGAASALRLRAAPFDLDAEREEWAQTFRALNPAAFPDTGGHRWCVPLRAGAQTLGVLVLADRVNGAPYTHEELALLQCIAGQVTSGLVTLRLAEEVGRARELEAFRIMSAFFVHDLKNSAASLNLMLKNLPVHFDDPAYREDALRAVGNSARRIDEMIGRLSALRQRPQLTLEPTDVNEVVVDAVGALGASPGVDVGTALAPLPRVPADAGQLGSVVTNLLLNARDAVAGAGRIEVGTALRDGRIVLTVADNGCGMSEAFMRDSLFRPFQTTKKRGLGIGMFQSRMVVEAHGGTIQVDSEPGRGTAVRVILPAGSDA